MKNDKNIFLFCFTASKHYTVKNMAKEKKEADKQVYLLFSRLISLLLRYHYKVN